MNLEKFSWILRVTVASDRVDLITRWVLLNVALNIHTYKGVFEVVLVKNDIRRSSKRDQERGFTFRFARLLITLLSGRGCLMDPHPVSKLLIEMIDEIKLR